MDTTSPNTPRPIAGGIHRGVWIGGGLMALTIVALATTLVVKKGAASPDAAAAGTPAALVAANPTPATPVNASTRPLHHAPSAIHHAAAHVDAPREVAAAPACTTCGVVEGYSAVKIQSQNNGVGAVAGGLGGALAGSKIAGRGNHTLGGVIGALGGGLLGNAIETHERTTTAYDVRVRMADGSVRTVRQSTVPNVGERVNVEGHTLHPIDGQG